MLDNFSQSMNEVLDTIEETGGAVVVKVVYYNESGQVEWDVLVEGSNIDEHLASFTDKKKAVATAFEVSGLIEEMGRLEGTDIE